MAGPPENEQIETVHCGNCGGPLSTGMQFCPTCGSRQGVTADEETESNHRRTDGRINDRSDAQPVHSGSDVRTESPSSPHEGGQCSNSTPQQRDTADRQHLEARLMAELENGWELEHDFGDHAVLMKRSFGSASTHLLIAVVTIWFTMGMANALYAGYKYFGDIDRKVVRSERSHQTGTSSSADSPTPTHTNPTTNSLSVPRIFAIGVLWLFGLGLIRDASLYTSGFGLLLVVTGIAMIPSVRRRIRNRDTITTNGRTQTVTEQTVRSPNKPCIVCHCSIDDGIERTYRERFRLLGIALVTTDKGANHYCRSCAGLESTTQEQSHERTEKAGSKSGTQQQTG